MRFAITLIAVLAVAGGSAQAATTGPAAYSEQSDLLLKRVDALSAEVPAGKYPLGTGSDGLLRFVSGSDWNSGFWAGTLWRVYDLVGSAKAMSAAEAATENHLGFERTKLHDLGFMYGESSVAAYTRTCENGASTSSCAALRRSGLRAADTLYKLAQSTGQRIIPMSARTCSDCRSGQTETIVDSMMNLPLLYWAGRETGQRKFSLLAKRHANWVAKHLQRRDGSTYQAARYKRSAKRARPIRHTHQGKSNSSVWARGQAWSIYGFADAGKQFRSSRFLRIAERNAAYVAKHLPADGLPLWDYRARTSEPRDVSAGVITAAGLFHLDAACMTVEFGCKQPDRWAPLARRILSGSLANIRTTEPVGYLGGQVYNKRNKVTWDDDAELMFGLDYALEAILLARSG